MIKKITTTMTTVNRIFHMADIHIRLYKRKDEYEKVFNDLTTSVNEHYKDGDIVVIVGDIVHAKTEMSPEMIKLTSQFFKSMANIAPTIIIAGNHDANLNNIDRMDAISPIIDNIKHDNLIYLKNSGLYDFADLTFSVMGVFEKKEQYKKSYSIINKNTKIALFHGPLNNSVTDVGHVIANDKMDVSFFNGFDIVLLGDIHKRQNLQEYEIETMVIDESELDEYLELGWQKEK